MEQAAQPQPIVVQVNEAVTKTDLENTKRDLRREMRLTLMAGSAIGTLASGLLAARIAPSQVDPAVSFVMRSLGLQ